MQGETLPISPHTRDALPPPESAPELADWIDSELGDIELAAFLRTHAGEAPLFVNGERMLPNTVFDLLDDLETLDVPKYNDVLNAMEQGKIFPELSPTHIVGNAPDEKKELVSIYRKRNVVRSVIALQDNERKVTHEEEAMTSMVLAHLNTLRATCGLPNVVFPSRAPHAIDSEWVADMTVGGYIPFAQSARVGTWASAIRQFGAIAHELTHFASHVALRVDNDATKHVTTFGLYRLGIETVEAHTSPEDEKSYLTNLNEAVTEETARQFLLGIPEDDPEFGYITKLREQKVQRFFENFGNEAEEGGLTPDEIEDVDEDEEGGALPHVFLYTDERALMYTLFEKMHAQNPTYFEGENLDEAKAKLLGMLQKAMFTGNILPFGRLFNATFGSGKFREFGRLQTTKAQEEFVAAL